MGGFKDTDLIKDDCGKTKHRQYGQHQRPPRMQQRKNQRKRYLNKDEKRDMSAQELDFKLDDNGQVYVQEEPSKNQVLTFKDIVQIPSDVQDIRKYHDYNIDLEQSLNDIGGGFDVSVNQQKQSNPVQFDFVDTNIKQPQEADVSNDDLILSEQQQNKDEQEDPFDALFNDEDDANQQDKGEQDTQDQEQDKGEQDKGEQDTQNKEQDKGEQDTQNKEQDKGEQDTQNQEQDKGEQSNDAIDEYLKMQIDDSKLSEQNKQKLDSFTEQQMDAFKKFLYQKRNNQ